jgi:F-type H+-transporting ATPase subunit b
MSVPLNIDWQQILLHLLNFVILAGGLYLLLYKPVKKFMDERTNRYKTMEEQATAKLKQAQDMQTEYEERIRDAEAEITQRKAAAFQEAEKASEQRLLQAQTQADEIIAAARQRGQQEREKILANTQIEITDMVTTATERLLLQASVSEAYDQFLAAAERSGADE